MAGLLGGSFGEISRLIASLELKDQFTGPLGRANTALGTTQKKFSTLEKVSYTTGRGLRNAADNLGKIGLIGGGLAVAGIIKSVNAASDLNESLSKTQVVFGDLSDEVVAWSKTSVDAMGLSQQQALETAGTFGNLFTAMGIGDKASLDMSESLVELASDLASFNNLETPEVLEKLRAGIVGEAEPLRTLGIQISAARTEAKAMELGFKKVDGQLSASAKAQANYAIILEDSKKAQGDFARTSDGLANSQRRLQARLSNTAATLGNALTPVVAKLAGKLDNLLVKNQPAIEKFGAALPKAFDQLVGIAERLPWQAIGSSLELAGKGSQAVLTAFTSMPDWVQTAVLTGWGLNKLTGGALGSIAGTLTKSLFGQIRGATAATPVFTKEVGLGGAGGAPGVPPGTGWGLGGFLLRASVFGAVALAAAEGLVELEKSIDGVDFAARKTGHNLLDNLFGGGKRPEGAATPIGQFNPANRGGVPVKVTNADEVQEWDERNFNRAAADSRRIEAQLHNLTLEQRLRNKAFKPEVDSAAEFLRILRRTSEFGKKGVGTTIEQGPTTGRDPFGKSFLALVRRLDDHTLDNNEVQGEIRRHITAARELLRIANREGDRKAQQKLQGTIDALRRILGVEREGNHKHDQNRRAIETTAARTAQHLREVREQEAATTRQAAITAGKDWSPEVNVSVPVTTYVSVSDIIRAQTTARFAANVPTGFTPERL